MTGVNRDFQIDAVIATFNRADFILDAVESVLESRDDLGVLYVVVNGSEDDTVARLSQYQGHPNVRIIALPRNLGVSGGKNAGLLQSRADAIVVIDDDAVFDSPRPLAEVRKLFQSSPGLGIVQFKIVNAQTRTILKHEFPAPDPERRGDAAFDTGYFIGAGHAIRKALLERCGYYPPDFFYAHEEIDLSYRAVAAGYSIRYAPSIAVLHKKAPGGRLPQPQVVRSMLRNRLIMSHKYLPARYRWVNNALWIGKAVLWSRSVRVPMAAIRDYWRARPSLPVSRLGAEALDYLRRNHGRLYR